MKEKLKRNYILQCLAPAFMTLMIFMGVLLVKGIFPFGEGTIDYYDMGQTNAPLYYHLWDVLHGKSALFYDWYINEGQNLSMGSAIQWNISPFNLFFLFVPRNLVMKSLSVFMGLHLAGMACTMYVFVTYVKKEAPYHARFIAALAYGLCGYTLTHYTIPTYLDTSVFLPILALGFYRLMKEGKAYFYAVMLGFTTALSYYLGFMHLIYILIFSGVWMFILLGGRENAGVRRDRALKIALGTLGGLALSAVMLIPAVLQMTMSSRFNSNLSGGPVDTIVSILNSVGADEYYVKGWQIYGLECALAVIIFGAVHFRKDIKRTVTVLLMVFIPCALIPFESINILWHFGTYYHYPIRCAYLIPFAILTGAVYFAGAFAEESGSSELQCKKMIIPAGVGIISAAVLTAGVLNYYFRHDVWTVQELYSFWIKAAAVLFIVFAVCTVVRYGKIKALSHVFINNTALCLMVMIPAAELIIGGTIGYGNPHFTDRFFGDPEQSGTYVTTAVELAEALPLTEDPETDRIQRLKNPDTELNTNYGMVMGRATFTGWANTVTGTQQKSAEKLGYGTHFMRILDSGGTFFTDSLLGVTDTVTCVPFEADAPILEKTGEAETSDGVFSLYHNKASFPSVIAAERSSIEDFDPSEMNLDDIQNLLYSAVNGEEGIILERAESDGGSERNISVDGSKALYMKGGHTEAIKVNGETVPVPTIGDMDNTEYPAWFNMSLVYLGSFENETVTVECPEKARIYMLDLEKLQALSDKLNAENSKVTVEKSALKATVTGSDKQNLAILPIHADPGFTARVNGEKQDVIDIAGVFTGVPISDGVNEITLTFMPRGLVFGAVITIITALIMCLLYLYEIRRKETAELFIKLSENPVGVTVYYLYMAGFAAFTAVFYIIPICWFAVHQVLKRLPF